MLGAIVGGVLGGVLGVALATPKSSKTTDPIEDLKVTGPRRRPLRVPTEPVSEQSMEVARQGLESKIAQLNEAIDDVRHQLGGVNGKTDVTANKS
ncbi:MAG: hypothetical protein HC805_04970 [Alkalinema sp. RL_2_19]|nr:hypothetical protein [Alkalinema sp. RL_2_19]